RLSTDSTIATITTSSADGGTRYDYAINLPELLTMIKENGASVFYRATDYDDFVASYDLNKHIFENSACSMSFTVDEAGYLTVFEVKVTVEGTEYGLSCNMSSFGSADAALPEEFLKAAAIETALEQ
ncbi:MAG: hypothetical protein IJ639_08250, partial [Ruminococcus sp.]|nr:hypothetical protein [Ruminococcus sp.]